MIRSLMKIMIQNNYNSVLEEIKKYYEAYALLVDWDDKEIVAL